MSLKNKFRKTDSPAFKGDRGKCEKFHKFSISRNKAFGGFVTFVTLGVYVEGKSFQVLQMKHFVYR